MTQLVCSDFFLNSCPVLNSGSRYPPRGPGEAEEPGKPSAHRFRCSLDGRGTAFSQLEAGSLEGRVEDGDRSALLRPLPLLAVTARFAGGRVSHRAQRVGHTAQEVQGSGVMLINGKQEWAVQGHLQGLGPTRLRGRLCGLLSLVCF